MNADVDNTEVVTVLSLCSGYGGLELGLARALANPLRVVAVEIEAYALANLVAKAEEGKLAVEALWPDLRTFPAERFRGCFDFILAGYPCQPFSLSGLRKGTSDTRWLWPVISRIIDQVRCDFVFLENVPDHLSLGFDEVASSLEAMGFLIAPGLYSAFEAGVGIEFGKRLFVLGQAAGGRRFEELRLSVRSRGQNQAQADAQRPGEVLVAADGERLPDARGQSIPPADLGGYRVAPQGIGQKQWEAKRYVEPGLGRAIDGTSRRVDRLRLLGNGVCPLQAETAIRELCGQIENNKS
jgi:DNA (cytosine-5)-methyltransferase 1